MAGARRFAALVGLAALAAGVLGPCLCGPRPAEASQTHGCCDAKAGLKPALDCCACPATLRAPDATPAEKPDAFAAPALVSFAARVTLVGASVVGAVLEHAPSRPPLPSTVLRI